MVRRAFIRHASLYIFGGIVLIGLTLGALNYETLFGRPAPWAAAPPHVAQTIAPQAKVEIKPLTVQSLLDYTNAARKQAGLAPMTLDDHLNTSASDKANDMDANHYYDHANPSTGRQGYDYIYASMPEVCQYVGENLYQFDSAPTDPKVDYAKKAVDTWTTEERDQKAALFDPGFSRVGFGIKGKYVVQHLCQLKS